MKKLLLKIMFSGCITLASVSCYANGIDALDKFLQNQNSTVSASFSQTVFGVKKNRVTSGVMEISRPNKFRWEYVTDGQLIVSDGKTIYIYDKPLKQVTEKKLTQSLGKSPALLLAGGTNIKHDYTVTNLAQSDGLEWVNLTPKNSSDNNGFKQVQIGFNSGANSLAQMKFIDNFDNKSTIVFTNVKSGINIPASDFTFSPPAGVDVIKN
ncbi:MAG: outer rane lipoprotein carrier protein [Pseudomonadota bacterium]|nr:outer rane lipoprotein carrier protein [Pseudomonadota bacterium]